VAGNDPPPEGEHEREDMFGDRVRVSARAVGDGNPALQGSSNVHRVGPGAVAGDDFQPWRSRDAGRLKALAAQHHGIELVGNVFVTDRARPETEPEVRLGRHLLQHARVDGL